MDNKRETINVIDITTEHYINTEGLPGFKYITESQEDFDDEKGFADIRCILQRESDGKFFAVFYTKYGCGEDDLRESVLEEVFPKEKTIIVYE